MSPQERLQAARKATLEGRYEEALQEFVWFHEHALEHQPWLYGVRLSFALGYWVELAGLYPPAMAALEALRDRKSEALLRGEGNKASFHDVVAINRVLGRNALTHQLILKLDSGYPELARECAPLALAAMVEAGDYPLAYRYIPDPLKALEEESLHLNESLAALELEGDSPASATRFTAYVHIYCESVRLLGSILRGVGEIGVAAQLEKRAIELVQWSRAREAVSERLTPPAQRLG